MKLFCNLFLLLLSFQSLQAQIKVKPSQLAGTYKCKSFSFGDYYKYNIEEDKIEAGSKFPGPWELQEAILRDIKNNISATVKDAYVIITNDGSFTFYNGKTSRGTYQLNSTTREIRKGLEETDITYNVTYNNAEAVINFEKSSGYDQNDQSGIYKNGKKFYFFLSNSFGCDVKVNDEAYSTFRFEKIN